MWATFLQYKVNADVMTLKTNPQVPENIGTKWLGSISTCLLKVFRFVFKVIPGEAGFRTDCFKI